MKWKKKGLIYKAPFDGSWKDNSALTPTPIILDEKTIRVYCGFRDPSGISRIGYVDLDRNNPEKINAISSNPVLDVGEKGRFDDNGVILGDLIRVGSQIYMFYVGFQLAKNVKFLAYSGLAISEDNGNTFQRHSLTPILDRADEALHIRAIHTVIHEDGKFKVWYAVGSDWEFIDGTEYPKYDINYLESTSLKFQKKGIKCLQNNIDEYRIGRPKVYKNLNNSYIMYFTSGTKSGDYFPGIAYSKDGIKWIRSVEQFDLKLSDMGWDSKHICYPAFIENSKKRFIFYNGNDMGKDGFGYAENIK